MRRRSMLAVLIVVAAASFGGSYAFASPTPAPNLRTVRPDNAQRCTQVFCVPQVVPRGPANRRAPNLRTVRPDNAQRCTQVFCVPQVVPRDPA